MIDSTKRAGAPAKRGLAVWLPALTIAICSATALAQPTPLPAANTVTILGTAQADQPDSAATQPPNLSRQFPGTVSRIAADNLQALGGQRLEDLAGLVPGLQADVSNAGLTSAVKLRGFSITRLHYNGLPDVQRMFSRDMATVDRVEVLAGPSALFFGSTAPGGVVNYLGKQPQFNERRALSLSVDDSGVARAEIDLAGRFGAAGNLWAYRVVAAGQDGEEPVARLPQRRHTALGAIAWRYANDAQLLIETEWMQNRTPFVFGTVIVGNGDTAQVQYDKLYIAPGGAPATRNMRRWAVDWRAKVLNDVALSARYSSAEVDRNEALLGFFALQSATTLSGYYTRYQDDFSQHSVNLRAEAGFALAGMRHQVAAGWMAHRQRWLFEGVQNIGGFKLSVAQPDFSAVNPATLPLANRFNHEQQREAATWVADRIVITDRLAMTLGLRHLAFGIEADRSGAGLATASDGRGLAHHVGITLQPTDKLRAYLAHSTGLEANRGKTHEGAYLSPQQQRQWEGGAHWDATPKLAFSATVYRLRLDNLSMTDPADRTAQISAGQRAVQGAQLAWQARGDRWSLHGHVHGLATRQVVKTSASLGDDFVGVARRSAGISLALRPAASLPGAPTLTLAASAVGPRFADAANTTRLPGYALLHTAALWRLSERISISAGLRNATDRRYVEAVTALDDVYQGQRRQAWLRTTWRD